MTVRRMEGYINRASLTDGDDPAYIADFYPAEAQVSIPVNLAEELGVNFVESDEAIIEANVDDSATEHTLGVNVTNVAFTGNLPPLSQDIIMGDAPADPGKV